ncbi:MAG: hypothetical protein LBM98_01280 [Oscillospiraceae bacterium]|nr:hypothetical protein [Oscillospiraceae bacterium]
MVQPPPLRGTPFCGRGLWTRSYVSPLPQKGVVRSTGGCPRNPRPNPRL